jgi:hypothetical protein
MNKNITDKIEKMLKEDLDESSAYNMYKSMLNGIDTTIRIIDTVISSSEDAKNLSYLKSARDKLKSAQTDLKMVPFESIKNITVKGLQSAWSSVKKTFSST